LEWVSGNWLGRLQRGAASRPKVLTLIPLTCRGPSDMQPQSSSLFIGLADAGVLCVWRKYVAQDSHTFSISSADWSAISTYSCGRKPTVTRSEWIDCIRYSSGRRRGADDRRSCDWGDQPWQWHE